MVRKFVKRVFKKNGSFGLLINNLSNIISLQAKKVVPNNNEEGRSKNRRVEISLTANKGMFE